MRQRVHMIEESAMTRLILAAILLLPIAGCGGPDVGFSTGGGKPADEGDGLGGLVGLATGSFLVLDLSSGAVTSLSQAAPGAAEYRDGQMLFRRVSGNGTDYFLGVLEVTQAQWQRLAGAGSTPWNNLVPAPGWLAAAVGPTMPAFNISHNAVGTAIGSYNSAHGTSLGLPSDGEWTFACSAGSAATWSWGSSSGTPAVLAGRAVVRESQLGVVGPRSVGGTLANAFGFYDMHGNVWEWTSGGMHVRGGSWHDPAWSSRSANQAGADDDADLDSSVAHALVGVRLTIRP